MYLTACISIRQLRVLVLAVGGAVPRIVPFLTTKVAGVRPQSTHSQVLLPILHAHWIVVIITLIPLIALLLRGVPLLPLTSGIPFPFILPELFGILGIVAGLTLWVRFLILSRLYLFHHSFFFFLGFENLSHCLLILI